MDVACVGIIIAQLWREYLFPILLISQSSPFHTLFHSSFPPPPPPPLSLTDVAVGPSISGAAKVPPALVCGHAWALADAIDPLPVVSTPARVPRPAAEEILITAPVSEGDVGADGHDNDKDCLHPWGGRGGREAHVKKEEGEIWEKERESEREREREWRKRVNPKRIR